MLKYDDGLCSLQDYNQLKDSIFDAVDEWINGFDSDPDYGLAFEQATLDVDIRAKQGAQGFEWFPLEPLVTDGEPDIIAIEELMDQIVFLG